MLNNTLNTNEIKNAAGVEQEFERLWSEGRATEFRLIGENPALEHRLRIKHVETGSGLTKRRRSLVRFDVMSISDVDNVTPVTSSAYGVTDTPIGATQTNAKIAEALANLMSFLCTTGAGTTVLFDGSGNGASVLLNGGL